MEGAINNNDEHSFGVTLLARSYEHVIPSCSA